MNGTEWFTLSLRDWPRSMTKSDYKIVSRWLRVVRNVISSGLNPLQDLWDFNLGD